MSDFDKKVRNLTEEIEKLKAASPRLSYIDCTIEVCQKFDVDFDSLKKVLSKNIQEKIEIEAMELNLLTYKNNTLF